MTGAPAPLRPPVGVRSPIADPVITGVGLVVPWSDVPDQALAELDRPGGPEPVQPGWFNARARLGPRGYKYLPPAGQYLLLAARRAIHDGGGLEHVAAHRRGATVGTNSGLAEVFDTMDRTVVESTADDLSPVTAPYFAINVLSSRLAAEHEMKGFQLTLTSSRVAGLEALETGTRALAVGRCSLLIAAAMEHVLPGRGTGRPASEQGAVALVIESAAGAQARGVRPHGRCRTRTVFAPPTATAGPDGRRRVRDLLGPALTAVGAEPGDPVHAVLDDSGVARAVRAALTDRPVASTVAPGAGCLNPMIRVAGLLAAGAGPALVVVATAEGNIAVTRVAPDRFASDPSPSDPSTGGPSC